MRRCRFCGCSDNDACPNICSWSAEDLCSTCATFKDEMEQYVKNWGIIYVSTHVLENA